jgi:hypothetical protein
VESHPPPPPPPSPDSYIGKFLYNIPLVCRENQAIAMARHKAYKVGYPIVNNLRTTPPPWVHKPDLCFYIEVPSDSEALTEG